MKRHRPEVLADAALLALLAAAGLAALVSVQPLRLVAVLLAACLVPGGAAMTRLRTGEPLTDVALAVGLSLAIDVAGSLALAWAHWWHPGALAAALAASSAAILLSDLRRATRA